MLPQSEGISPNFNARPESTQELVAQRQYTIHQAVLALSDLVVFLGQPDVPVMGPVESRTGHIPQNYSQKFFYSQQPVHNQTKQQDATKVSSNPILTAPEQQVMNDLSRNAQNLAEGAQSLLGRLHDL